ncbi:MAG: dihydrodipicolinate synthase family protein [Castellaniella sp.]
MTTRIKGVLSPVVTPFDSNLKPDAPRFVRHCQWLLDNQVGLAVFGTNSEANSLTLAERMHLLDALVEQGLDASRMMPGTGSCTIEDTVQLTAQAVKHGCAGVLMLPPFYYKGVTDEGLYRYFSEVIQRVGDARLRIYLYHIPPVSQVPISLALIERLLKDYPQAIAGVKDSSGDWNNTLAMLEQFQPHGFDVFAGSETFLLETLRHGGAGCISATANVNPAAIHALYAHWQDADADERQQALNAVRSAFQKHVMIPAMKRAVAHWSGIDTWAGVRPPLVELDDAAGRQLIDDLQALKFEMPGMRA